MDYSVFVSVKAPNGSGESLSDRVLDELEKVSDLNGPVIGQNVLDGSIDVSCGVEATDPRKAIEVALTHLCLALDYKDGIDGGKLLAVEASPYVDPVEQEAVSRSEIARRLGISPARVHQLAKRPDFPKSVQKVDSERPLYRWGDVLTWERHRKKHSKPGRPKKSEGVNLTPRAARPLC